MTEDRITQRTITAVMIVIAALAFVFSFGNVWSLALRLGVPGPIAPLIAPMVDLSVVGLLVALRYLSLRGVPADQMTAATRLMHFSGLLTLALNVAEPIVAGHYGRAAVDAVAPLLLLGWGSVGPQLLRAFHTVARPAVPASQQDKIESVPETASDAPRPAVPLTTAPAPVAPPIAPAPASTAVKVPEPLLTEARSIAMSHHTEHGEPITAAQLKTRLGIGLPMATALHAAL
ncbi:DUF2637 domain-containing protein [Streptomyces caniscabiei]|uniref:DUF2637 domain-containing protein n=1 Tax=Streptomyces caniscabiei TaxID=2746961 RepID=A0ABU4N4Y2_9ACTN|nr:DUF2637 domain-containing protein [Streptomyces caniscabiei]MBE4741968.1 DUF2637 domain-containing protein [Streptomyces caniscabiei]MBE4753803.1 DUF2637 domain-containing protein [Streptomyces caniscabiei]MBE4776000.1 DUF2637 domain-containing protein [Streptomyces caniscabiei]MBE4790792.1 DUF2637 domain-containing protein [Streptomyces caniscabiei]MBE4799957.1 DUF2637 domain-containing protein [Streptomyces caniscabiei]